MLTCLGCSQDAQKRRGSVFSNGTVHDGYLEKQTHGKIKRWQRRHFRLSGHYLAYFATEEDSECKGSMDLNTLREMNVVSAMQIDLLFTGGQKTTLRATSESAMIKWVAQFKRFSKLGTTTKPALGSTKPGWDSAGVIDLEDVGEVKKFWSRTSGAEDATRFTVQVGDRAYDLMASTPEDALEWMQAIQHWMRYLGNTPGAALVPAGGQRDSV